MFIVSRGPYAILTCAAAAERSRDINSPLEFSVINSNQELFGATSHRFLLRARAVRCTNARLSSQSTVLAPRFARVSLGVFAPGCCLLIFRQVIDGKAFTAPDNSRIKQSRGGDSARSRAVFANKGHKIAPPTANGQAHKERASFVKGCIECIASGDWIAKSFDPAALCQRIRVLALSPSEICGNDWSRKEPRLVRVRRRGQVWTCLGGGALENAETAHQCPCSGAVAVR